MTIDERSGQVAYDVMSFGGVLGTGDSCHPLPCSVLSYGASRGGYVIDLDRDRLQGEPGYASGDVNRWSEPGCTRSIDDDFGAPSYAGVL